MKYCCRYDRMLHSLYLKDKHKLEEIRSVFCILRGKTESRTAENLILPLTICLFPLWRSCYKYLYGNSANTISRRVRYRLAQEKTDIRYIEADDLVSIALYSCLDVLEDYLTAETAQALHTFIINNLPAAYCRNVRDIALRYRGYVTTEVFYPLEYDVKEEMVFDNIYRERYLLNMSKSTYYRMLRNRECQGSSVCSV